MIILLFIIEQNLPFTWSQSYSTYDEAQVLFSAKYSFGFGINNYCIYSGTNDTIAYDERRFDIWARTGFIQKIEFELKYSYPTASVISLKYHFFDNFVSSSFKFGFGYMKGTRVGYITDYVYDFYGTLLIVKNLHQNIKFIYSPKIIYSIHTRDRQEHTDRPPRYITHYGHCFSFRLGKGIVFYPEINWLWGNNENTNYMVNQFGIGVNLEID